MGIPAEKIISEALQLPQKLRAIIAERLIESLDSPATEELSPEWHDEIAKRCHEIDQNSVDLIPAKSVFERAQNSLK